MPLQRRARGAVRAREDSQRNVFRRQPGTGPARQVSEEAETGPVVPGRYMEGREKGTVWLDIPSRLQMLEVADEVVGQVAKTAGIDEDRRLEIQAAVHESLVNAILHGNHGDETRRVTLELDLDGEGLEIRVRDEGRGFDPARLPDPLAHENLCKTSGRGILLMKALMDAVTFRRPRSGGMEVTMRKRLAPEVESPRASSPAGAAGP